MDECPAAVEGRREQRRVLVLGRLQHTHPFPADEVSCLRQTHERSGGGVADIDDVVLLADAGDPWVLDTPVLLETVRHRLETPDLVDLPSRQSVLTGRDDQGGQTGAVLDAQEEQRSAVDDRGAGIEHCVDHSREALRSQYRVAREPLQ